jgi:hypothetical protein
MRWTKLGKVFDPTDHQLMEGCREFAQSPQALVFDDFVRIYFSTRQKDPVNGKYISHIAYVDMDKQLDRILRVSTRPVLERGTKGAFDEHGIFPINVVRWQGRIHAFTCGWTRRVSVSVDTGIGAAVSEDGGETFTRIGPGPVLTSSLNEPFLVGDGFVLPGEDRLHMWYIYGTQWKRYSEGAEPDRTYKIGYAHSQDGLEWVKEGRQLIEDILSPDESQALPTVLFADGRYHMFFCFRESSDFRKGQGRGYRLGYAHSGDGRNWTRDDAAGGMALSPGGWDSQMQCYPHIFECDGQVYLLYNGNEFGRQGFGAARLESFL